MSLWSLYQSIDLSINMIKGGVSREQVARYLAVLTATIILTTLIGKVCFTEDTLIKTEDGHKEIKDIEVGDLVYSEDPLTGEKGLKRVTNVFVNETSVIVKIYVGDEEIETTPTHPFWVIGKGWVAAGDIEAGDKVYLYSGEGREVKEVRFEYLDTPIKVYNFEVEDWHTYFVSEQDVFVHNSCEGKGTSKTTGYRYVSEGELNVIKKTGTIPNTDRAGNLKDVFVSPDKYNTVSGAEKGLQIGKQNPFGATDSPMYRVEFDMSTVKFKYGGNVQGGTGIELITEQVIPVDLSKIFRLR
jgi:hypothetical protein